MDENNQNTPHSDGDGDIEDAESASPPDEVSQEAVHAETDAMLEGARQEREEEHKSIRSKALIIVGLIIILTGGGVFWAISSTSDETDDESSATSEAEQTSEPAAQEETSDELVSIIYAHSDTSGVPRALFSRPASGGDREPLGFDLGREFLGNVDQSMDTYAVVSRNDVYVGNGTEEPRVVYTLPSGADLSGLDLSNDAKSLLITHVSRVANQGNTAEGTLVNLESDSTESLFTRTDLPGGIIVEHWNSDEQTFLGYETPCWGCGAGPLSIREFNAQGEEINASKFDGVPSVATVSMDGSRALYYVATTYTDAEAAQIGLGPALNESTGAPYDIFEVDLATGQSSLVAKVGSIDDELNQSNYFDTPELAWGGPSSAQVPAYSYQTQLFVQNQQGNFDNWFETSQGDITQILAVGDDELLVAARLDDGLQISYFNIEAQEGAIVMETLDTTTILTVTRQ